MPRARRGFSERSAFGRDSVAVLFFGSGACGGAVVVFCFGRAVVLLFGGGACGGAVVVLCFGRAVVVLLFGGGGFGGAGSTRVRLQWFCFFRWRCMWWCR